MFFNTKRGSKITYLLFCLRWYRDFRRAVSADEANEVLQREASLLRRLLSRRPNRTVPG